MNISLLEFARLKKGFTLLELLIVVVILSSLGGIASFRYESLLAAELNSVIEIELANIKCAILNFERDAGRRPVMARSPADLGELFQKPADLNGWNMVVARGWRGPYLEKAGAVGYVDIGAALQSDGVGSPVAGVYLLDVPAVADSFYHQAIFAGDDDGADHWYLNWVNDGIPVDSTDESRMDGESMEANYQQGRPYLVFDIDDLNLARVISFGRNGVYEAGGGDDLVLCLYRSACS
ncbi:MAG: hypothetical protein COB51_04120 [Moraxellaceae bacterium]|nr:MAG: hypothetical protein COB51_04120 [Moraxellaceae bacterium]